MAEAAAFRKPPFIILCLPSRAGCWLAALVTHSPESVPGESFHPRPHVKRPAGLQGEDISG